MTGPAREEVRDRIGSRAREQLPQLKEELGRPVAIPSVSEWGFPEHTRPALLEARDAVVDLLRDAGVETVGELELPGTAPVITGGIEGPEGAPTVLLYGHYDVVAAAAAFLTPVATPANLMVMEPGGYRFGDYWRLGLPLLVLFGVVAILLVPLIWSF